MARKATFCVVVPAYNEEVVIEKSLRSLFLAINKKHVYVVSDGSTDNTSRIARRILGKNVLSLRKNVGKAKAIKELLTKFKLTQRYQYVMFFDADTLLSKDYFTQTRKYINTDPACIVGTVTSSRMGLVSAHRVCEYGFTHKIFKNAQNFMGTILVAPGCASTYKSDVLEKLNFFGTTLTEDLDLTIQIHHNNYGKIIYSPRSKVITQDPPTIPEYFKQVNRWYTGFWQNFFTHKLYKPNKRINFEVLLVTGDFLLWLVTISFLIYNPLLLFKTIALGLIFTSTISALSGIIDRQYWVLRYIPLFPLFWLINLMSYSYSLFRALNSFKKKSSIGWNKVQRYAN